MTAYCSGIDFDKDGKQAGFINVPHSVHRSGYGKIPIPLYCIRNGDGPTVFLSGGVHGDEYEGQLALAELARCLSPTNVTGRLLVLPIANHPAAQAGLRTSPIDDMNLNRCFPGKANGTVTEQIAFIIENELLVLADYALDLHSGGTSSHYVPIGISSMSGDTASDKKRLSMLEGFGLPRGMFLTSSEMGVENSLDGAMVRQGVIGISAEFGGSGLVSVNTLKLCKNSVNRILHHLGVLHDRNTETVIEALQMYDVSSEDWYIYCEQSGTFEPRFVLGDRVEAGNLAGYLHDLCTPSSEPTALRFATDGEVLCKRALANCMRGDCLVQLGKPV